jgi:translation initiation factor 2 subunit 3
LIFINYMSIELKTSEIIKNQATINIGTAGSVAHGKSSLVRCITGMHTQKFKEELLRNITIKLGYSGAKIYYDPETGYSVAVPSNVKNCVHPKTGKDMVLVRHISFVDCPGHDAYMSTMITGSTIMDHVFFVVAADKPRIDKHEYVPIPVQTYEHLGALMYSGVNNYLIIHNKIDLLKKREALDHKIELDKFMAGSPADGSIIIPISAENNENIDKICKFLQSVPVIKQESNKCIMTIVRSFNPNRPNTKISKLTGAVVGGTITSGILAVGDLIEIRPGVISNGKLKPLFSKVVRLECDGNQLEYAVPGGLVAVGLELDAGLSSADRLVGFQLGHIGSMSDVADRISGKYKKIQTPGVKKQNLINNEQVKIVSKGAMTLLATVIMCKKKMIELKTETPFCVDIDDTIVIMRKNKQLRASTWKLHSIVVVQKSSLSIPIEAPSSFIPEYNSYKIINDIPEMKGDEVPSYNTMLESITVRNDTHSNKIIELDVPELSYHTRYTHFMNAVTGDTSFMNSINMRPDNATGEPIDLKQLIAKFFRSELATVINFNVSDHMIITGKHKSVRIKTVMQKLANKYFRCDNCNSISCYIEKLTKGSETGAGAGAGGGTGCAKVYCFRKICCSCPSRMNCTF